VTSGRLKARPPTSQEYLAARVATAGVSLDRSAISRIEGESRYVLDCEVAALAKALKVPIQWLFGANS
jgi:transcriptional regulator with XRE-family HTH domain